MQTTYKLRVADYEFTISLPYMDEVWVGIDGDPRRYGPFYDDLAATVCACAREERALCTETTASEYARYRKLRMCVLDMADKTFP